MNIKTDWDDLRKKRQEEELSNMYRALQESYASPIMMFLGQMEMEQIDDYTFRAAQKTGVHVSEEELIKALQYDRDQFRTGFIRGWTAAQRESVPLGTVRYYLEQKNAELYEAGKEKGCAEYAVAFGILMDCIEDLDSYAKRRTDNETD